MTPPRAKWTDPVLDERFRSIDQQTEMIVASMEPLRELPDSLARVLNRTEDRLHEEIMGVAKECSDFRREFRRWREDRERQELASAEAQARAEDQARQAARAQEQAERELDEKRLTRRTQAAIAMVGAIIALVGVVAAALINSGHL